MRYGIFISLLLVLIGVNGSLRAQSSNDYLDALEGEASDLSVDSNTRADAPAGSRVPASSGPSDSGPLDELVPGLEIEQFEQVLKRNYMGSYLFYNRLSNSLKDEVYAAYRNNPDPEAVRSEILRVSKR